MKRLSTEDYPDILLSANDVHEVTLAAHWLHQHHQRSKQRDLVTLNGGLMARILGRAPQHDLPWMYTAEVWDGTQELDIISSGLDTIWKTGAHKVFDFVLNAVGELDLSCYDWAEKMMWEAHCTNKVRRGEEIHPEYAPVFRRKGLFIPESQALASALEWRASLGRE